MHPATRYQAVGVGALGAVAAAGTLLLSPATVVGSLEGLADTPVHFAVALVAVYLVRPLFLWPVSLVALVLGYLYDPWLAIPVSIAGATLTCLPPFALARYVPSDRGLLGRFGRSGAQLAASIGETRSVVAARLLPVPGDVISYSAGLSAVSLPAFVLGTAIGEVPWTLAMVALGGSMRSLSVRGVDPGPEIVLGLAGLAVILMSGPIYRHLQRSAQVE